MVLSNYTLRIHVLSIQMLAANGTSQLTLSFIVGRAETVPSPHDTF